jgi:hypothetical protein
MCSLFKCVPCSKVPLVQKCSLSKVPPVQKYALFKRVSNSKVPLVQMGPLFKCDPCSKVTPAQKYPLFKSTPCSKVPLAQVLKLPWCMKKKIGLNNITFSTPVVTLCTTSNHHVWPSLYVPPVITRFNIKHSTFCPHSVFVCSVRISEQTAIISLYSIDRLVSITQT